MDKKKNEEKDLDVFERAIEDHFEGLKQVPNVKSEMARVARAAKKHGKRKKVITLRVHEMDLEAMRLKASKLGMPYQTYINALIHQDATRL